MPRNSAETTIPAGQFKARVLKLLDRVARTGRSIVITKRGKPVARLAPLKEPRGLEGSITHEGDIVSPIEVEWESEK